MTEIIHVIETESTADGPVNITLDGRRIPVRDILAMESIIVEAFGKTTWLRYGREHREDGPAVTYDDCHAQWYLNGNLHRDGGPAVISSNGAEEWWLNGQPHRTCGPAFIHEDGSEMWVLHGRELHGVPDWIAANELPPWREWTDLDQIHFRLRCG